MKTVSQCSYPTLQVSTNEVTFDSHLSFLGSDWSVTLKNFDEKVPTHVG